MDQFDFRHIAISASTYYPKWYRGRLRSVKHTDKVRGDLTIEFCEKAISRGYKLVIVDSKSSKSFIKELRKMDKIRVFKSRSLKRSPARRLAIKAASKLSDVKIIVLTEPEKISILEFLSDLAKPILRDLTDIVVPKREGNLFCSTYPLYMYESEIEANKLYNEALRSHGLLSRKSEDLDMFFGPRVFANEKRVTSLFMKRFVIVSEKPLFPSNYFDPEEFSNTLSFPVVLALKRKLKVKSITIPFKYPKIQKENEEKAAKEIFFEKRRSQRLSILLDLMHFIGFIEKESGSRLRQVD